MLCVELPSDQALPVSLDEVSVTDPPSQKAKDPLAATVGGEGMGLTITTVGKDTPEAQPF